MSERLRGWLQRFGEQLEKRDATGFAALFTEGAEYFETPFGPPLKGRSAIRESVAQFAVTRANVRFEYSLLCADGDQGIVWWRLLSNAVATGADVEVDGIFIYSLAPDGQCHLYREWWHKRERAPE